MTSNHIVRSCEKCTEMSETRDTNDDKHGRCRFSGPGSVTRAQGGGSGNGALTAERRLVCAVGAVGRVVAHPGQVDTHAVARALPLPAGAAERRRGAVALVAHVPAVVVAVAEPAAEHAVAVVAAVERGGAGARRAGVVLVRAVLTVGVAVALPGGRHAAAVRLALELRLVVAHPGRPRG